MAGSFAEPRFLEETSFTALPIAVKSIIRNPPRLRPMATQGDRPVKHTSVDIDELVGIQQHPAKLHQSTNLYQSIRRRRFGISWASTERQLKRSVDL